MQDFFMKVQSYICGHEVPVNVAECNAVQGMNGNFKIVPSFVNNVRVNGTQGLH